MTHSIEHLFYMRKFLSQAEKLASVSFECTSFGALKVKSYFLNLSYNNSMCEFE